MGRQFRSLFVHFFERFFDTESPGESDGRLRIIQLLALLSVPGLMLSFFMKSDHPPGLTMFVTPAFSDLERIWLRVGDRYIFVSYSMIAMGLLMAFKWDSLFADRRDYLALTALPISMKRWFAAKVAALCAFLALFVAAINAFSLLIVPHLIAEQVHAQSLAALLRAFLAHAAGTLGGALFAALFFVALQGVLINLLSASAFRRISPYVQMVSIGVLVTLLLVTPLIKESIPRLAQSTNHLLDYLPFMWFLGLYEWLIPGGSIVPQSAMWSRTALEGLLVMAVVAAISYAIGYRRYARKVLESVETESLSGRWWSALMERCLEKTLLKDPVERGTFHFISKIAARSSRHRILTALYIGIATGLALTSSNSLEASLAVIFVVVAGLRATFNVPYELNANWIFQITEVEGRQLAALRKWVLLYRIFPILAVSAILECFRFTPLAVFRHVTFDAAVAVFLVEAFFFKFNKVPFTCSFAPDKVHFIVLAGAYLFGFTTFVGIVGMLKRAITEGFFVFIPFVLFACAIYALIRQWRVKLAVIYQEADSGPLTLSADGGYWKPPLPAAWRGEPWNARVAAASLLQDLRFGVRILWKSPGLSACAVLLLALVIGGNATIYSFAHSFIASPAPAVRGDGLVVVGLANTPAAFFPVTDYMEYAEQSRNLRPLLGFVSERFVLTAPQGSYELTGSAVTPNYFETLGVPIAPGRPFTEQENRLEGAGLVAVISDRVWKEQFESSPEIVGRQVALNGQPATIIGVAPPDFQGAMLFSTEDVWVPLLGYSYLTARIQGLNNLPPDLAQLILIGRLAPHAFLGRAEAEFATLTARLSATRPPGTPPRRIALYPYSATVMGDAGRMRQFLSIFSVVTLLTLLIVCANVANLMLGRASARQRETAVRQSLGAPRSRILTMLLAEGLAISAVAWLVACVLTVWVSHVIRQLLPHDFTTALGVRRNFSVLFNFKLDWNVLLYGMGLAVIGTLIFSIVPVVFAWRQGFLPALRAGDQGAGRTRSAVANLLVVVQFAFSVLLLTSAGLAYRSMSMIQAVDVGFNKENLLLVSVNPTLSTPKRDVNLALLERVRERLAGTAGVRSVSYVRIPAQMGLPMRDVRGSGADHLEQAGLNYVGPGYLAVLGLTPVAGRDISEADRARTGKVALINRNLAEALWPGRSAVGQTMTLGKPDESIEIVGVAPDALLSGNTNDTHPKFVLLAEQQDEGRTTGRAGYYDSGETTFYMRYTGTLDAAVSTFGRTMREVDDKTGIDYIRTMDTQLETFGPARVLMRLLVLFAAISLLIAAIGQYAVVTFSMGRRVREFGVRIAVGASSGRILGLVMREGLLLTLAGMVAGCLLSFGTATALQGLLFGITPSDPLTYAAVSGLLAVASLFACYLPARRASRVDPLVALRYE